MGLQGVEGLFGAWLEIHGPEPEPQCASRSHLQQSIDLFNYLLRQRIIFLAGYVNDKVLGQEALVAPCGVNRAFPASSSFCSPGCWQGQQHGAAWGRLCHV